MARRRHRNYKDEYWRPIAKRRVREINFPIMYFIPEQEVLDLADEVGWERLAKALQQKQLIEDAYLDEGPRAARAIWASRDRDLPDWFWYYHTITS